MNTPKDRVETHKGPLLVHVRNVVTYRVIGKDQ